MAPAIRTIKRPNRLVLWLLQDRSGKAKRKRTGHQRHAWWQVMCLTGVDYFSTLGYQPGIAALAAGTLAPFATLVLVLLTVFGALPIYRRVAVASPHGEGSIAMLEHLLPWWQGKLFVLCLLGFVATDFIITITLSAADATAHVLENPFTPNALDNHGILITLILVTLLAAVFLKGFREAIGIAVVLVIIYLCLNLVVIAVGLFQVATHPLALINWRTALFTAHGNPVVMLGLSLLLFPKLALGLSGFETGVAVMPLVQGEPGDTEEKPVGRIRNTHKLLMTAALIMSVFLLTSSLITTVLIPAPEFAKGGAANGRALAYLAHYYLGDWFGTLYDLSTISILWFAGASAMAGLLNIMPRYLPRYGMAPTWANATRPLVLVFTAIAFTVTLIFRASVDAQGGAYATGVLVLISSASMAVTLVMRRKHHRRGVILFSVTTLIFIYTTLINIYERPEGIKIASFFIGAIILTSLISRVWRSTELRVERFELDDAAIGLLDVAKRDGTIRIIANHSRFNREEDYARKEQAVREDTHVPPDENVLFLEVTVCDPSEFADKLTVKGVEVGKYRILSVEGPAVPNAIAAFLLYVRDYTGKIPHAYFGWSEGNPIYYLVRFILFGEGDIAPVTREVLRKAERNPERRPVIHVGG
ncbi:APC family permease [soil metagenome]